ncbi:MAG TPA: hypothetical protein VKG62_03715 [Solirubrobacteraceae bacterium]|nr:hypothetical protein [Solirubrobacteraceae bacterium]
MKKPILLAVPNVSEGRDEATISAIAEAFSGGVRLLDVHSDRDHHRSVFTLLGEQGALGDALLRGARATIERVDVVGRAPSEVGGHPHVGAVDVMPIVYLEAATRGAACAEALVVGDRIGSELGVPVFVYGELAGIDDGQRTRSELRRGGVEGLAGRLAGDGRPAPDWSSGGRSSPLAPVRPDFGPTRLHPTAGATLLAARPPLVAFNLRLKQGSTLEDARAIAALIREGGDEGLPGVRAIGLALTGGVAQVSMNVERPEEVPLAVVTEAVRRHAEVQSAELVGLAPAAALEGFPDDVPIPGFDPARHTIENAIG